MNTELIALILDIVVLIFLGAAIVYVVQLSKSLRDFKKHRHEFDKVISDLLSGVDKAERSIHSLKQVGSQEAESLGGLVLKSRALIDELTIINEAGEGMAKRLEKLAEQNREIAQKTQNLDFETRRNAGKTSSRRSVRQSKKISSPVPHASETRGEMSSKEVQEDKAQNYAATLKSVEKDTVDDEVPSFMIQDRDFEGVESLGSRLDSSASNDQYTESEEDEDAMPENLQSQAERDLFEALRNTKRNLSRGGQ
ncbi:MAG: DUF6468 domain-containing protein [Alphaproteobacteria bacterium]